MTPPRRQLRAHSRCQPPAHRPPPPIAQQHRARTALLCASAQAPGRPAQQAAAGPVISRPCAASRAHVRGASGSWVVATTVTRAGMPAHRSAASNRLRLEGKHRTERTDTDGRGNASSRRTSGQGVDGRPRRGTERGAQGCVVAFVAPRARQVLRARKRDSLCAAARGHATPARAPALGRGRVAACPVPLMGVCMVAQGRGRAASASPSPGGAAQGGAGTGAGLLSSVMTRLGFLSAGCLPGHLRARTRACTHGAHGCLEKNACKRVFGHAPTLLTLSSRLGQCFVRTRWQACVRP